MKKGSLNEWQIKQGYAEGKFALVNDVLCYVLQHEESRKYKVFDMWACDIVNHSLLLDRDTFYQI